MSVGDDRLLLGRARRGDEAAFSQLFARYQRQVFRYAAYMCGMDCADDVVQDTFLAVLRQSDRHDAPRGNVISYLIGIARHLVMKRQPSAFERSFVTDEHLDDAVRADEPDAVDRISSAQSTDVVRRAVQSLPPQYREAIVVCELHEIDYETAARLLECPIGTVRSRLHRARTLLAQKLSAVESR